MIESIKTFLKTVANYDLWSLISLLILMCGSLYGYLRFFQPRKGIRNLTISYNYKRLDASQQFPLFLTVEFSNHTGQSIFITSVWFKCKNLRPDPNARCDTATGKLEIKFPQQPINEGEQKVIYLKDFEYYLPEGNSVATIIPVDPAHTDEEVKREFINKNIGHLDCYITLLSRLHKPLVYRIKNKPYKKYVLS